MPMPVDPGGRGTGPGWNPGERLNPVPGDSGGVPIKGGITPIVISGPPLPGDPPPPPSTTTSKVFRPDANEDINTALDACVPLVYGLGIVKAQVYYRMYSNLNEVVDFGVCLGPIDSVVSWWDGIVPAVSDVPPDTDPGYRGTWALTDLGALTKTPYPGTVLGHWEKMANWSQSQEYMINPSLEVKGMLVYDPRLDSTNGGSGSHRLATPSTWEWSDNPALCFADFKMSTRYGAGVASAADPQAGAGG